MEVMRKIYIKYFYELSNDLFQTVNIYFDRFFFFHI